MYFDGFSPEDQEMITRSHVLDDHNIQGVSAGRLLSMIQYRVYEEWCMANPYPYGDHSKYDGAALRRFIDDETHYAIKDKGFVWDLLRNRFISPNSQGQRIEDEYPITRREVLDALVLRAIDLFESARGLYNRPVYGQNMRTSLKPWLEQLAAPASL